MVTPTSRNHVNPNIMSATLLISLAVHAFCLIVDRYGAVALLKLESTIDIRCFSGTAMTETDESGTLDPPPPANRYQKRNTAISKLSNQVKALELNLQVTNR